MGTVSIHARRGRVELTFRADNIEPIRFPLSHKMAAWMAEALRAEVEKVAPPPLPENVTRRIVQQIDDASPSIWEFDEDDDPFASD